MKPWHAVIGLTLAVTTITALPVMAGAVEAESCDTAVYYRYHLLYLCSRFGNLGIY